MCNQPTSALGILYPSAEWHLPSLPVLGCQNTTVSLFFAETEMRDRGRRMRLDAGVAPGWRLVSVVSRKQVGGTVDGR